MINTHSIQQKTEAGNACASELYSSSIHHINSGISITHRTSICIRTIILTFMLCLMGGNEAWGQTTSYVLDDATEYKGGNDIHIYTLNGPGCVITFQAKEQLWATSNIGVYISEDNSSWIEIAKFDDTETSYKSYSVTIKEEHINAKYIKFVNNGTLTKYVKDVKVTRATTLSTSTSSIDFGTQHINTSSTKTASIDFNNTTYNQQVTGTCTDSHFTVTPKEVGETGNTTIDISYTSTTPGIHSGTVTLSMNGKSVSFPVSGSSEATYNFSALTEPNNETFGSASASVTPSITSTNASESPVATFTATANDGYEFVGWGTTANATTYESTENPYSPTITNSSPGTTVTKKLYAIFCPVFNFSVNANKRYDHGTVSASVVEKILGEPSATSMSTEATFTATPNEDCTFEGWFYDAEHKNKASDETTFTTTVTNSEIGSTKDLTLYAWFKKNQTLSWDTDITDFNLVQGTVVASSATSTSGLPVSYNSSNSIVASVDTEGNVTGNVVSNDGVVITALQEGNDEYNQAPSISRTFHVLEKLQASFVVTGFTGTNPTLKVEDAPTVAVSNTDDEFTYSSSDNDVVSLSINGNIITMTALKAGNATVTLAQPANDTHYASSAVYNITVERHQGGLIITIPESMKVGETLSDFWSTSNSEVDVVVTSDKPDVVSYDNGILTAKGEGTATITASQAENVKWEGESRQQTIVVSKVANTLGVSLAAQEAQVDGTINVAFSNQNNENTPITATITEQSQSSSVNNGTDVIAYENGTIIAKNAGTAKITFTQEATEKYEGYTSTTYDITVNKIANPITITLDGQSATAIRLKYGVTATLSYSSPNEDTEFTVNRKSGSYTTCSGSTITAGNTAGTDIYEITQAETYKYEAGYATFSIRVNNTDEAIGYVLDDGTEYSHGGGAGVIHTYTLSGPGETLYYSARRNLGAIYYNLYAEYSTDGNSWDGNVAHDNTGLGTDNKEFSCSIPETARYVRFRLPRGGTGTKYVNNVKVTRKTYVRASADNTNLGTVYTGETRQATFTVDYSTTNGGNIHINSSNANFALSETELAAPNNSDGSKTFTVTYTPNPSQLGEESALITVADLFYIQEISLTATAAKRDNTLTVIGEQNLKVGDVIEDVYSNKNSNADLNVSISNEGVVAYDATTNTLTAIGEGTATITFTQNANDLYHAVSKSVTVNVTKHANTLNVVLDKTDLKVEETANVTFDNHESDGAIAVSYTTDGIVSYADGIISAISAGSTRITFTQAATTSYEGATQSFDITVTKHDQTLVWDNDITGDGLNLSVGQVLETNTATASSGLAVTYSSSNPAVISVDESTGLLTAHSDGANIIITATQTGNHKYNEASITRRFSVSSQKEATVITNLSTDGTNELTVGEDNATIGCNAPLTADNFTISGNTENVILTSFENNTLTITPNRAGEVTVRLDREEDANYHAIHLIYTIKVNGAIAVIRPDEEPALGTLYYDEITLERSFKTGYSTLALPFDTNISELAGEDYDADNDWLAQLSIVTYNAEDGYTLYFRKITDGIINANRPYILHLSHAVTSPAFHGVVSEDPIPGEHHATGGINNGSTSYTGWKMVANYTPAMSMEGYYGIADNKLMLGGSTSTLNAYSAYIAAPEAAPARVRIAIQDDSGNTTDIISIRDTNGASAPAAYNLNGVRSREESGIRIVIGSDGVARKVLK